MKCRLGTSLLASTALILISSPERPAQAADLPQIKISEANTVPACVTPGRLMSYIKSRNEKLDPKFESVAVEYMRHGEEFGLRWDYAFFQMMLETNTLKYTGDVKVTQNNFAGLGATGGGARGESFQSVSDGVRAHLQHVLMYAGAKVEAPVAQRTRDIQAWGVLTKWQATINGPMTYSQLGKKWAPTSRGYSRDIEVLAGLFFNGACKGDDPNPELVAEARKGRGIETDGAVAAAGKGAEIAKQAIADARIDGASKTGLGAESIALPEKMATANVTGPSSPPVKLLNAPVGETADEPATETAPAAVKPAPEKKPEPVKAETAKAPAAKAEPKKSELAKAEPQMDKAAAEQPKESKKAASVEMAALTAPLLGDAKPPAMADAKCRVFTASYGGAKSIIIKAMSDSITNYTVLDVNDGAERREADAYISAYAKGGEMVGEPQSQDSALERAFELCPEG